MRHSRSGTASEAPQQVLPTWLPSRGFIATVLSAEDAATLATMEPARHRALPKIQNRRACLMPTPGGYSVLTFTAELLLDSGRQRHHRGQRSASLLALLFTIVGAMRDRA